MAKVYPVKESNKINEHLFTWDKLAYVGYLLVLMGFILGIFNSTFSYLVAVGVFLVVLGSIEYWVSLGN